MSEPKQEIYEQQAHTVAWPRLQNWEQPCHKLQQSSASTNTCTYYDTHAFRPNFTNQIPPDFKI